MDDDDDNDVRHNENSIGIHSNRKQEIQKIQLMGNTVRSRKAC